MFHVDSNSFFISVSHSVQWDILLLPVANKYYCAVLRDTEPEHIDATQFERNAFLKGNLEISVCQICLLFLFISCDSMQT